MGYSKQISANSVDSDGASSHQTSPAYVLTFIPWINREIKEDSVDDQNFSKNTDNPYIVVNDAINITVNRSKSSPAKSVSITLVSSDVNYASAIHPSDYVMVNLVDFEEKSREIHRKVINKQPINGIHDGFKGVYRISTVTRSLMTAPNGLKSYRYTVNAIAFTEFTSTILYNPAVQAAFNEKGSRGIFMSLVGEYFTDISKTLECQKLLTLYFKILLGKSTRDKSVDITKYGNTHFKVPGLVSSLLGLPNSKYVNEIYHLYTGVWKTQSQAVNVESGFNPGFTRIEDGIHSYKTGEMTQGGLFRVYENWNEKNIWSILTDVANLDMNELYTTFRVNPNGRVVPSLILRQKPFTNEDFQAEIPVTKYLELPRWVLDPALVKSFSFTTNDALRKNFVQTFAEMNMGKDGQKVSDAVQISNGNFIEDVEDIARNGIRPYISRSRFGYFTKEIGADIMRATKWNKVIADWVMNAHLKENGTIISAGIEEPIAEGDNLEFDGVVYHIEGITDNFNINDFGYKSFTTTLSLSHGILARKRDSKYVEMDNKTMDSRRRQDYNNNKLIPGVGESQDRRLNAKDKE